jgi:TetR/AcrR family transcriptional regulator, regulator of autoinduction and epiphytic fitness
MSKQHLSENNSEHPVSAAATAVARAGKKSVAPRTAAKPPAVKTASEPAKPSFKQQMLAARQEAIIDVVNKLLAEKGFDAMTVDEVAYEVGVAKASLYKHFPSKEDLGAAAMVRVMQRAMAHIQTYPANMGALACLQATARWMMQLKLQGAMPNLPSQNSSLRATLAANKNYVDALMWISDTLGGWIEAAQARGEISRTLPAIAVLYTLYARACDPVLEFLKASGQYTDEQILQMVELSCFEGLLSRT